MRDQTAVLSCVDSENLIRLLRGFDNRSIALVACTLRGRPIPVICVLSDHDTPGRAPSYVPFSLLVNEFNTDLLNDLVPPPTLHGEWCWTHVPQKNPPSPFVPPEGDATEGGEPA